MKRSSWLLEYQSFTAVLLCLSVLHNIDDLTKLFSKLFDPIFRYINKTASFHVRIPVRLYQTFLSSKKNRFVAFKSLHLPVIVDKNKLHVSKPRDLPLIVEKRIVSTLPACSLTRSCLEYYRRSHVSYKKSCLGRSFIPIWHLCWWLR